MQTSISGKFSSLNAKSLDLAESSPGGEDCGGFCDPDHGPENPWMLCVFAHREGDLWG